jgi:8-oxo-dGTP pyrophosphatase MutT (NUDIX family)
VTVASRNAIIASAKSIPVGQAPTPANQGLQLPGNQTSALSPLAMELQTGAASWGSAYRNYLPRPAQDFTEGAFGPFSPILPVPVDAPDPGTDLPDPRLFEYQVGWNLPVGQPGSEGIKLANFDTLRTLADTYSVARACIQLRKSEIRSLEWDILPTQEASKVMRNDRDAMRDFGERRAEVIRFFKKPDPDYFSWSTFIDALLEEVFVFDAMSLLIRSKRAKGMGRGVLGSDLDSLNLISGQTIRPLLDLHGARPRPPAPAYQQYLYGVPRTDLMTLITERDLDEADLRGEEAAGPWRSDQLIYLPMVPRRWTPYGFPPIERALIPVMSGLQKQGYQLDYFREGTVPAVFVSPGGINSNMTPNQLRELQDALNAIAGDPAWKHKIIVLPADSRVDPQKSPQIADQFDEIVMNQVTMAFDVMPMELGIAPKVSTTMSPGASNQMAKMNQGAAERKATRPTLMYLQDIFDSIIQNVMGQGDMRFVFELMVEEEDEATKTQTLVAQISAGLRSIDEGREELNLQPWGLPETSDPGWATPTGGFVPLPEATIARQTQHTVGSIFELPPNGDVRPTLPPGAGASATPGQGTIPKPGAGAIPTPGQPSQPTAPSAPSRPGMAPPATAPSSPGHEAAAGTHGLRAGAPEPAPDHLAPASTAATHAPAPAPKKGKKKKNKSATPGIAKFASDTHRNPREHQARRDASAMSIADDVSTRLTDLVHEAQSGNKAFADTVNEAVAALAEGYNKVMADAVRHAAKDHDLTVDVPIESEAQRRAEEQRVFLMGMLLALVSMHIKVNLGSRLTSYVATLSGAYNWAYNEAMNRSGQDFKMVWRLGAAENCQACIDRDGQEYDSGNLPGLPGEGGFGDVCMGGPNCKCSLEYIDVDTPEASLSGAGYYQMQLDDLLANRPQDDPTDVVEPVDTDQARLTDSTKGRSVHNELDALARHLRRGRLISTWTPKHISQNTLARIAEGVAKGLDSDTAVAVARQQLVRRVDTNGEETWVVGSRDQWSGPAGGGGNYMAPHDADDLPLEEKAKKDWKPDPNLTPTEQAIQIMLEDFPPSSIGWMRNVMWHGPTPVPADKIDWDDMSSWAASHERKKVNRFHDRIEAGRRIKPIIAIRKPGSDRLMVVDGHHRALASRQAGVPVEAFVGRVPHSDGPWNETHSYQRTQSDGGSETAAKSAETPDPIAAGVVLMAEDTGRVLMLQRALSDDDSAAGTWEFPGGKLEPGESAADAAGREWSEETGLNFPDDATYLGGWTSADGVYQGFVYSIVSESELPILGERDDVINPDDPDGDDTEALAWWSLSQLVGNPAIRQELAADGLDRLVNIIGD